MVKALSQNVTNVFVVSYNRDGRILHLLKQQTK